MRAGPVLVLILLALAVSACGGGDSGKRLSASELRRLVLHGQAVAGRYERFDFGRETRGELASVLAGDPSRFGRQDGWKARYRLRAPGGRGPLTVASTVDVFEKASGARSYYDAVVAQARRLLPSSGGRETKPPSLGDDAFATATGKAGVANSVRTFSLVWRDGRFVAALSATGFATKLTFADVAALARRQQRSIEAAR